MLSASFGSSFSPIWVSFHADIGIHFLCADPVQHLVVDIGRFVRINLGANALAQ